MTDGFEVLVQLVMAAMTTSPCVRLRASTCLCAAGDVGSSCPAAAPPSASMRASWRASGDAPLLFALVLGTINDGNASANDFFTCPSGTRSCGRFGPATLGSILLRSSSTTCEYDASGVFALWNRPCSLQYASTSETWSALRPVMRRYLSVSSSTGKMPQV